MLRRSVPLTALNRGILISPSKGATGRTGSTSKVVRSLGLTICSKASISALRATLGADRSSSSTWGPYPGDNTHYVNAKDMLSLSLLQARLLDLKPPIKIAKGE
jgi:hypothetical protein